MRRELKEFKKQRRDVGDTLPGMEGWEEQNTANYEEFKCYIKSKNLERQSYSPFYSQELWRKLRWRSHVAMEMSQEAFLKEIQKTFGEPGKEICIAYGDWCRSTQMRRMLPTLGVGLRRLVQKRFKTILVDEFRTSKLCCHCHKDLSHEHVPQKGKLWRSLVCHECGSLESKKARFITRDLNSAINIRNIAHQWIHHQTRPEAFCRQSFRSFS